MTEETINEMFPPYEWRPALCTGCAEYKGCVTMADDPVCYNCLESYYDDGGEHILYAQKRKSIVGTEAMMLLNTAVTFLLGAASAIALALAFLAPFLMTGDEVIAFWRGI